MGGRMGVTREAARKMYKRITGSAYRLRRAEYEAGRKALGLSPRVIADPAVPSGVKALRERLGLSQPALAQRLGVSVVTLSRWENGRQYPLPAFKKRLEEMVREAAA